MEQNFEIKNKVAESGLVNFDITSLIPKGKRIGVDLKDFLWEGLILKEKDFRESIKNLDIKPYQDAFIYIYNSADAIVPLWAYFLLTAKLNPVAKRIVFGDEQTLLSFLIHDAFSEFDFSEIEGKRILVKGCSDMKIPENAFVELVSRFQPIVKSLMFGEACSNVPILKN